MKLGDLGTFKTGGTPSRSKNEYWGDKYPWISSTALGDVYIDENAATDWISDEGLKNSSTKLIKANSLMIGIRIGVGKCSINRIPMCTSQDVVSIEEIDTERYYLPYITTLINNKRHYLERLKRGATIQGITTDIIKNLQIPDIQINRQKLIADTIQVVDDMVCLSHKQLAKLDTLVKSRFIEMFGVYDETTLLSEVSDMVTVGIANSATHAYRQDGIVMFRNQNIRENHLDDNDLIYIAPDFAEKYKSKTLRAGDILVTRTGYPGIACIVPPQYDGAQTFTTLIVRISQNSNVVSSFVCHYINSDKGKCFVAGEQVGVAQQNFGAKSLAKMPIPIPPIDLQNQFAAFVQQVDKSKSVLQKLLEKQELLRAALMQEYFG